MIQTLQDLKDASADLTAPQRVELAHFLLESLEPEVEDWAASWQVELTRRLEEIQSGKVVGIPADEVLARLRVRYP